MCGDEHISTLDTLNHILAVKHLLISLITRCIIRKMELDGRQTIIIWNFNNVLRTHKTDNVLTVFVVDKLLPGATVF